MSLLAIPGAAVRGAKRRHEIDEEIRELRMALRLPQSEGEPATPSRQEEIASEFGDVLFSLVNLARFVKVNPEDALRQSINRFVQRFQYIEAHATASGRKVNELSVDDMNKLWEEAKSHLRPEG